MRAEGLQARLKELGAAPPAERGGRFPLAGRSFFRLLEEIERLEMDAVYGDYEFGYYSSRDFRQRLEELAGVTYNYCGPDQRFEDVINEVWDQIWEEYFSKEGDPHRVERLCRLLRELLITPILRIDTLRNLPHRGSDPGRSILTIYRV